MFPNVTTLGFVGWWRPSVGWNLRRERWQKICSASTYEACQELLRSLHKGGDFYTGPQGVDPNDRPARFADARPVSVH
jgi:hypothetical protein